ncbi:MAG: PAS domain S-box protein [Balneolaceae bacterium]|nr:MAG: PAS domain S-box protein [Balneolaceae bacterium]
MKRDERPIRILLIEDNPGDALLVEEYLEEYILRPELKHVERFNKAEPVIQNEADRTDTDIILLDLSLPDISKDDLIEKIRLLVKRVPVIILTGYGDLDFAVKSLSIGVSDYLVKDTINALVLYKSVIYSIERHRFIRSLRESEKRYMDLFELNPSPMWVFDAETLEFLDANQTAVDMYGYSKEEFLTMTLKDIRPPDDIPLMQQVVDETLEGGRSLKDSSTFRHQKKDGTIIYVEIRNNVIEYKNRKAIVAIAIDVTEKLSHLKAIEEQNTKLKEISWMQSHIVRAPVSRLMGIIDLMKTGELDMAEKEQMLDFILTSAEELDDIIRDISSKSEGAFSDLNLEK